MPRSMTAEEYQELGRRYYRLKQFDKALQTFNDAIDASPTLSLHDHRAACYDKLGEFKAAVEDGRAMIKLEKQDVRGYLRTASVLEKMELPERALGIYKYGMKHVPVHDKNFPVSLKTGCSQHRKEFDFCSFSSSFMTSSPASSRPPKPSIRSQSSPSRSPR